MLQLPEQVQVYEVGPRDGLQNEPAPVPTEVKVELIQRLAATGLPYVEASSFVHPRWIPQLGDAEDVFTAIERREGVRYGALVPNMRGLERAEAVGVREIAVFISASETHNGRNLNRTIDESLQNIGEIMEALQGRDLWVRGYVSMVFGCPYEGDVALKAIHDVTARLFELGIHQVSLGDTVGTATPRSVSERIAELASDLPLDRLALHFHDTRGTALANIVAGLDAGVSIFDGSVGGLGGCPYAPGASGNVATEDLVQMLHSMGIETGIDLTKVAECSHRLEQFLERTLPGKMYRLADEAVPS